MKRSVAIFFIFIFLTAHTIMGQFLRLPILIHHFTEHVAAENCSLMDFLEEHYAATITHPDDQHHDHQKLPFKAGDTHLVQCLAITPQFVFEYKRPAVVPQTLVTTVGTPQYYPNACLGSIWQPPRIS